MGVIWTILETKNYLNFEIFVYWFQFVGCVSVEWHCLLVGMFWLCLRLLQLEDSVMGSLFSNLKPCAQLTLLSPVCLFIVKLVLRLKESMALGLCFNQNAKCGWTGWFLSAYFLGGYGKDGRGVNGQSKALTATAKSWALGIPVS